MFAPDNHEYYAARAAAEREAVRSAPTSHIASIHEQLAEAYEALVAEIEARPPLRLVGTEAKLDRPPPAARDDDAEEATASG
jgi:hypothetical protein